MTNSAVEAADDPYRGYRGTAREKLEAFGVRVWSEVTADTTRGGFRGIVLPRSETADDRHIVLKLERLQRRPGRGVDPAIKEKGYRKSTTRSRKRSSRTIRTSPT